MTASGGDRWDRIDRAVDGAAAGVERRVGTAAADALRGLRGELRRIHVGRHEIGELEWAAYATDLDRGTSELQSEVARSVEHAEAGPSIEDVLYARRTQFEIEGWALHYAATEPVGAHVDLVVACRSELARFRGACASGATASRAGVDDAVARLRAAVERAG